MKKTYQAPMTLINDMCPEDLIAVSLSVGDPTLTLGTVDADVHIRLNDDEESNWTELW